jgi:excisionase family DNA binding protein
MLATPPPQLLRISDAAEQLNVSRASVYRWIDEGRLPAVQLGGPGAPVRIPSKDLEAWLAASRVAPQSAAGPGVDRQSSAWQSRAPKARRDATRHDRRVLLGVVLIAASPRQAFARKTAQRSGWQADGSRTGEVRESGFLRPPLLTAAVRNFSPR